MLKRLKTIIQIVLAGLLLGTASARELAQIIQAGKLRVAVIDTAMPPFMTRNEKNEFQGFELDLLRSCAETMNVQLELVPVTGFDDLVGALVTDRADIAMSKLSRTLPRILKVNFSQPYAKLRLALMINRQEMLRMRKNESLDSYLRHYTGPLVVQKVACRMEQVRELFPKAQLIFVDNREAVDDLIEKRQLIAYFDDQIAIRALMQCHAGSHLFYQRVIFDDTTDCICIGIQPDCPRLRFFLNCFLEDHMNQINSFLNPVL